MLQQKQKKQNSMELDQAFFQITNSWSRGYSIYTYLIREIRSRRLGAIDLDALSRYPREKEFVFDKSVALLYYDTLL